MGLRTNSMPTCSNPSYDALSTSSDLLLLFYNVGLILLEVDDRIGHFNLSFSGHARCVEFIKKFNIPLMVLGGGGYTIANVAKCWVKETALLVDEVISNDIPFNEYFQHYAPLYQLEPPIASLISGYCHPTTTTTTSSSSTTSSIGSTINSGLTSLGVVASPLEIISGFSASTTSSRPSLLGTNSPVENQNTREELERLRQNILEQLRDLDCAPSVQMDYIPPGDFFVSSSEDDESMDNEYDGNQDSSFDWSGSGGGNVTPRPSSGSTGGGGGGGGGGAEKKGYYWMEEEEDDEDDGDDDRDENYTLP
eukprot:TRINITY_DN2776_c0_g1_i11.p1 TRINITY_DN2776_c0_g1~~TRINITY_DN2776_c0_g1_i11.p1  ORF type:complete len:308 (+),score=107.18 TRINITY_DN2776_c0_g1_i11:458-1381(+)